MRGAAPKAARAPDPLPLPSLFSCPRIKTIVVFRDILVLGHSWSTHEGFFEYFCNFVVVSLNRHAAMKLKLYNPSTCYSDEVQ